MRILLIGATGFIGSAVAARLAGEAHALVGTARSANARRLAAASGALDQVRAALRHDAEHGCGISLVWMQARMRTLSREGAASGAPLRPE